MIKLIVFSSVITLIFARHQTSTIVRQFQDQSPEGSYEYAYETDNGIFVQEEANVRAISDDNVDLIVRGSFLYKSPDGKEINLQYTADDNGFHPEGEHLPTPPPIPPAILKALEWNAAHPEEE